jgi:predicted amidohydrolase
MRTLRIGLGQIAPELGRLADNLERHRQAIADARAERVDLLVMPELGLTGYLLRDLNAEMALAAGDDRLVGLARAAGEMSVIVGFVEQSADGLLYNSAALLEGGAVAHVQRKAYLPNYGMFEERRYFAAGDRLAGVNSRVGARLGISICEDFWHLPVPYLLALDGADVLVNISSSPGRDVAAAVDGGLGTAVAWQTLFAAYAMLTACFVIYVNRVGVEEEITFWGGSQVLDPSGQVVFRAANHDEGLHAVEIDIERVRQERARLPLLRDERPEFVRRQLERLLRARAGDDEPADEAS